MTVKVCRQTFPWKTRPRWGCAWSNFWPSNSKLSSLGAELPLPASPSFSKTEPNPGDQKMNLFSPNRRKKASILVAEDESIVRADMEDYLKSFGYRVSASVATGEEAKRQAIKLGPDVVLMDIIL